jgi:putative PIN family toxin of toxin-antitoxin system
LKIVLDTNVYISAAILGRVCEEIVQTCRFSNLQVFISKDIIDEIEDKLSYKFLWQDEQINLFLESIMEFCQIVKVNEKLTYIKDDPDDDKILECAVSADCNFIISGDKHLLKLKSYETMKILNPADFLLMLRDESSW